MIGNMVARALVSLPPFDRVRVRSMACPVMDINRIPRSREPTIAPSGDPVPPTKSETMIRLATKPYVLRTLDTYKAAEMLAPLLETEIGTAIRAPGKHIIVGVLDEGRLTDRGVEVEVATYVDTVS